MSLKSVLATGAAASALALAMPAHAGTYISLFGGVSSFDADNLGVGTFTTRATVLTYTDQRQTFGKFGGPPNYGSVRGSRYFAFTTTVTVLSTIGGFDDSGAESGFVVGVAGGLDLGQGWRAEIEAAWRQSDRDAKHVVPVSYVSYSNFYGFYSFTGTVKFYNPNTTKFFPSTAPYTFTATSGPLSVGPSGSLLATARSDASFDVFSLMANVWYDFDLEGSNFVPFIGGGLGMARIDATYSAHMNFSIYTVWSGTYRSRTVVRHAEADDWVFAWQFGAGLGYEFENGMMLSAQYRYFATGDASLGGRDVSVSSNEGLIALNIPFGH